MGPWAILLAILVVACGHLLVLAWCRAAQRTWQHDRQWSELQVARRAARVRAEALLREQLTPEQYAQLRRDDYLAVPSPTVPLRVYRIPRGGDLIEVYEAGRLEVRLCVQPVMRVPDADVILTHKLMIEGDEQAYLRIANRISVRGWF